MNWCFLIFFATPLLAGNVTKTYTFGTHKVAQQQDGTTNFFFENQIGTAGLATRQGQVIHETRKRPFGQNRWAGNNQTNPSDFGFTGQREEATFGLIDYKARYYNPLLGRFISPDTITPNPKNSQDFNRYTYVINNPVRYSDPTGHSYYEEDPDDPRITSSMMHGEDLPDFRIPSTADVAMAIAAPFVVAGGMMVLAEGLLAAEAGVYLKLAGTKTGKAMSFVIVETFGEIIDNQLGEFGINTNAILIIQLFTNRDKAAVNIGETLSYHADDVLNSSRKFADKNKELVYSRIESVIQILQPKLRQMQELAKNRDLQGTAKLIREMHLRLAIVTSSGKEEFVEFLADQRKELTVIYNKGYASWSDLYDDVLAAMSDPKLYD